MIVMSNMNLFIQHNELKRDIIKIKRVIKYNSL